MNLFKSKELKKFEKMSFESYSQDGEDMIIRSFYETNPDYKGFYIDIGAYHPFRFSNTMFFYKSGWRGINIEPSPNAIELFHKYRPEDINLNMGISDETSNLTFYCFNEPALNSFSKQLSYERNNKNGYFINNEISVDVFPLSDVLNKYLGQNQAIDFINIDVEGLDINVLRSNDWNKYSPKYLLVESISDNIENILQEEIYKFLKEKNYQLISKTLRTLIFKKQ